jgi:hypothetical protein
MTRFILVTIAGAVLAVLVGPRGPLGGFWAPGPEAPQVDGALRAGFAAWSIAESVAFGIGLAILLLGRTWFVRRTASPAGATAAWLAAVWLFASWMPHAALHQHIGMRPAALLAVEWAFHGGAILAIGALLVALAGVGPGSVQDGRKVGALRRGVQADGHQRHRLHDA